MDNGSGSSYANPDTIVDFKSNEDGCPGDLLDLSAIDANPEEEGQQSLVFSGQTAQSWAVWYQVNSNDRSSTLYADTSGDLQPEFAVLLRGVTALSAHDLIL